MTDSSMTNILKNFDSADNSTGKVVDAQTGLLKDSAAATEKNAMKVLLEGLDSQQRSVNQMPAPHKMAKNTATKHPAGNFLVGGEFEDDGQKLQEDPKLFNPGDKVVTTWEEHGEHSEPLEVVAASRNSVKVKDDAGNEKIMDVEDLKMWAGSEKPNTDDGKRREQAMGHQSMGSVDLDDQTGDLREATTDNFTADDLQTLNNIKDLGTLKQRAIELISNQDSTRPMKPEKVEWFTSNILRKTNTAAIIKMMWDLLLSGEGTGVIGTKGSTQKSSYRTRFEDSVGKRTPSSDVHKKQSLSDIFRSMDEAEQDKEANLAKEFHSGIQKEKELHKGDNGKFDLAENSADAYNDLVAHIKNLSRFGASEADIEEEMNVNNGETFVVLARKIVNAVKEIRDGRI